MTRTSADIRALQLVASRLRRHTMPRLKSAQSDCKRLDRLTDQYTRLHDARIRLENAIGLVRDAATLIEVEAAKAAERSE
jgi:septal ring factor EnvC (AmiA/AmiB activator)